MILADFTHVFLADITPLKGFRADVFCPRDMLNDRTGYYFYIVLSYLLNYYNFTLSENSILSDFILNFGSQ